MNLSIASHIGWSLIHLLWQAALVAIVGAALLWLSRNHSAGLRSRICTFSIIAVLVLPVATLLVPEVYKTNVRAGARSILPDSHFELESDAPQRTLEVKQINKGEAKSTTGYKLRERSAFNEKTGRVFFYFWIAGVLVLASFRVGSVLRLRQRLRAGRKPVFSEWSTALSEAHALFPELKIPQISGNKNVSQPLLSIVGDPCIHVPGGSVQGLQPVDRKLLMAHELAHLLRNDIPIQWLLLSAKTLLFYHPAVWWLSKRFRWERELHCDEIVVSRSGDASSLAQALVALDQLRANFKFGVLGGGSYLKHRLVHLGESSVVRRGGQLISWGFVITLMMVLVASAMSAKLPNPEKSLSERYEILSEELESFNAEFRKTMRAALRARDSEAVFELICPHQLIFGHTKAHNYELADSMRAFLHSRYEEVFRAPENGEELCGSIGWKNAFFMNQYNKDGVSSVGGPGSNFYPSLELDYGNLSQHEVVEKYEATDWFVRIDRDTDPFLQIDIEPDGIVDLSFDGDEVASGPKSNGDLWHIEKDESEDGTRMQWLIGPAGNDLRAAPRIWIYRDGPIFAFLMDTDGDGRGNLGRGACIP